MTIRGRLAAIALLPIIMALLTGLIFLSASRRINQVEAEGRTTEELVRGIFDLNLLTGEYLVYHGARTQDQWQLKHTDLGDRLRQISARSGSEQLLLQEIRYYYKEIGDYYSKLVTNYKSLVSGESDPALSRELIDRLSGLLLIKSHSMYSAAGKLSALNRTRLITIREKTDIFTLPVIILMAVVIALVSILTSRTIARSVSRLHKGTEMLADGNLDFKIEESGSDELSQLARSFNDMIGRLKKSRTDLAETMEVLQRENMERRKAEEALRHSYVELEQRVVERTLELSEANRHMELARQHSDKLAYTARMQGQAFLECKYRLKSLMQVSEDLHSEKTKAGLLKKVTDCGRKLSEANHCILGHTFVDGKFSIDAISSTLPSVECPADITAFEKGGVYRQFFEQEAPLRLTDQELREHPAWKGLPEGHIPLRGLLGVSLLRVSGSPVGVIMVTDKTNQGEFTETDEILLGLLAKLASLALENLDK